MTAAFKQLEAKLPKGRERRSQTTAVYATSIRVYITFDEAHPLTVPFTKTSAESDFSQLRRALNLLRKLPLFTFFLSTAGTISQFIPSRSYDASERMIKGTLSTPTPFIHLGFDQLMGSRKVLEVFTHLDHVTSLECIAHMGRPMYVVTHCKSRNSSHFIRWGTQYDCGNLEVRSDLIQFALQKLLCARPDLEKHEVTPAQIYAILSQRLPLDVNTTVYTPLPINQVNQEQEQISNHMRVVVSIRAGIESIRGIAASEPILSEAAYSFMCDSSRFCLPEALSTILGGAYAVNTGDRAELLVAALFTWARDTTVTKAIPWAIGQATCSFSVTDLFSNLFSEAKFWEISKAKPSLWPSNIEPQRFDETFCNAWMHFSHFIKPQKRGLLYRPYLLTFMARGAAAFGANCQPGVDAVYPFLYNTKDLDDKKVSFIMVQVKTNDVSPNKRPEVFEKMDPYQSYLLRKDDNGDDGTFPIPIIRVVFVLISNEPAVTQQTYKNQSERHFTSYDFWCSGLSPDIFLPVNQSPGRWQELVDKADEWDTYYRAAPEPNVLRSQFPACSDHDAHFNAWVTVPRL